MGLYRLLDSFNITVEVGRLQIGNGFYYLFFAGESKHMASNLPYVYLFHGTDFVLTHIDGEPVTDRKHALQLIIPSDNLTFTYSRQLK